MLGWEHDYRSRTSDSDNHQIQPREEQQRWNVASHSLAGTDRLFYDGQARVAQRKLSLPPQQYEIGRHRRRHNKQQPQHLGPEECHHCSRCCGKVPPAASRLRLLRKSAKRKIASIRLSSVASSSASTPAWRKAARKYSSRCAAAAAKRLRNIRSCVSTKSCSPVSAS